jgi:hypothetical protein
MIHACTIIKIYSDPPSVLASDFAPITINSSYFTVSLSTNKAMPISLRRFFLSSNSDRYFQSAPLAKNWSQGNDGNLIPDESHNFTNQPARQSFLVIGTGKTVHTTL